VSGSPRPVVGIFGAGKVGVALARLAVGAGYTVHLASSGSAAETAHVSRYFAPGAVAATAEDLTGLADILIIAVPLHRFRELPLATMGSRIVVDVMNYWPPINGVLPEFEEADRPSSTVVRDALPPTAQLVKTFNHLGYHQLEELARPQGTADRAGLAIAGDDPRAVETVADLVDDLGFDPLPVGALGASGALEADSAIFGQGMNEDEMRRVLGIDRAA
jgi:predicted dinucleotide-binding enzyme